MENLLHYLSNKIYLELLLILILIFISIYIGKKIISITKRQSLPFWIRNFLASLEKALPLVVGSYGFFFIIEILVEKWPNIIQPQRVTQARHIFIVIFFTWLFIQWKKQFLKNLATKSEKASETILDKSIVQALDKVFSIIINIIAALVVLDIIGIPVSTLIAFGGIGGIAIGLAAKDVLSNFFSGLMIYVNHPFAIGDWIKSPNKGFEGVVEEIGWYRTQIRSFERRPTYIPNAVITDAIIENPGRMYHRRIRTIISLRYEDINRTEKIVLEIRKLLTEHPKIDHTQLLLVHLLSFGDSAIEIEVYAFTTTLKFEGFRNVLQEVLFAIAKIVKENNADFAFPTRTLHLYQENKS